jgi:adenine-specific DNA glycosylase
MLKAAQTVTNDFWWIFPQTSDELSKLAGVGPYTAEAIKAFAYDESTLSFDTNLEKIFSRYYFGNKFRKLSKEEKAELLNQMQNFCEKSPLAPLIKGGNWTKWSGGLSRDINNALMDYGATISLNSIPSINWDEYPLKSSKFYKTRWELEPVKEKKKSSFPSREAIVFAILHEDHKKYFSGKENFSPFFVWKNTWNPRAMIQEFFRQKFWLELSVRPPEIKSYKHETPYMVCYCQIQSWKHNFKRHEWLRVRWTEESLIESMPNI